MSRPTVRYAAAATQVGAVRIAHHEEIHTAKPRTMRQVVAGMQVEPNDIIGQPLRLWRVQVEEVPMPPDVAAPDVEPRKLMAGRAVIGFVPFAILTGVNIVAERAESWSGRAWDRLAEWMGVDP